MTRGPVMEPKRITPLDRQHKDDIETARVIVKRVIGCFDYVNREGNERLSLVELIADAIRAARRE